ncbi:membrane-spanning 4-domains subfamily A member 8-like [Pyxicephalus adspersus]|uniref:membrane-spanning 4-domains subfamily A member 8-like n=1 Tax=Pyxicephalus adspersus TaxID=30357 RepID=UPI003B5CBEBC
MTTTTHAQSPNFVEHKVHPVACAPPGQPWNAPPVYAVPSGYPQQTITVNPQIACSTPFYETFLKGKPRVLGNVLLFSGSLEIVLGIASIYTAGGYSLISAIDFWGAIIYIIAGSLTLSAAARPNICMIKGSLAMNILTAFFSVIAFVLVCLDLAAVSILKSDTYYNVFGGRLDGGLAVLSILLIINLLLFSVSISMAVFGCQAMSHASATPQMFVIQSDIMVSMPQPSPYQT